MVPTMMMQCVEHISVVYTYQVGVRFFGSGSVIGRGTEIGSGLSGFEYSNLVLLSRYPDSTCGLRYS